MVVGAETTKMSQIRDFIIGSIGALDMAVGGYSMNTIDTPQWVGWFFVFSGIVILLLIWIPLILDSGSHFISERSLFAKKSDKIQRWFDWRCNKPHFVFRDIHHDYRVDSGKISACTIYCPFIAISKFYYGNTLLVLDRIKMVIRQRKGGKYFYFNMNLNKNKMSVPPSIGPAGCLKGELAFDWAGVGSEEQLAPNLDFEFSWKVKNIGARLMGPGSEIEGILSNLEGVNFGRRV